MRNHSVVRNSALAAAAALVLGFATSASAQVVFIPPLDAPDGGDGTVGILRVTGAGGIGDQNAARAALLGVLGTRTTLVAPHVNLKGDGGSQVFPNDFDIGGGDDKSYMIRGNIRIANPGVYTFDVNSDDGFTLAFNNGTVPFSNLYNQNAGNPGSIQSYNGNADGALTFFGGRGAEHTGAQVNFAAAGDYHFDLSFHDGCCDDSLELTAAEGAKGGFDNSFKVVGGAPTPANAGQNKVMTLTEFSYVELNNTTDGDGQAKVNRILSSGRNIVLGTGTPTDGTTIRNQSSQARIRFHDPEGSNTGSHGADAVVFPGNTGADDNDFGGYALAQLTIAGGDAGRYTFAAYSDDAAKFRVLDANTLVPLSLVGTTVGDQFDSDGVGGNDTFGTNGCCSDQLGHYDLALGNYLIEAAFQESGGGAGWLLYGTKGDTNSFDAGRFQLLGTNADLGAWSDPAQPGGLQLVAIPEPSALALLGLGAVAMLRRRRK